MAKQNPTSSTAKNLMIVESPAKAKTIEKYLGNNFIVRASFGHIRDLIGGDKAIDIENNFAPSYEISEGKEKVINELKQLVAQVETVWLATDEDREGEGISWHLAVALGLDIAKTHRVVFNEITKNAIAKAVQNPRTIDINLVNAQQARRVLDRLVGFKLSPLLWRKIKSGLSAGRVQSVAVRLIVEREREIREFKPTSSYKVTAEFLTEKGELVKAELSKRFDKIADARAFLESCIKAAYTVTNLETKPGKKSPAPPFTTSTLQQEASRKLSFSVKKTMKVAQDLYESGRITYMRTDSTNLSDTALQQAQDAITQMFGANYHQRRQYKTKNASAQEAHEAIRPTDFSVASISASNDEQRLYELIWKRATASQMADAQLEKTVVDITVSTNKAILQAIGEVIKFDGFLKLYLESKDEEDDEEGSSILPPLKVGQSLSLKEMVALERYTRPNARYTEAALVKKMEELGIGRPSTYAPTISTIQDRQYVLKDSKDGVKRDLNRLSLAKDVISQSVKSETTGTEKNKLFPTDLGKAVTEFLVEAFQNIMDYSFTASVEVKFDEIAEGKLVWQKMIGDFYTPFAAKVGEIAQDKTRVKTERLLGVEKESGKNVYAKIGPFGPMIQIGETSDEEKPRFASMRKDQVIEDITLDEAMGLFVLPRTLGEHNGKTVKSAIGRFGPYIQVGSEFASINKEKEREGITAYNVTLEQAVEIFLAKQEADANKIIKTYTGTSGAKIVIARGKWNRPYLRYEKENVPLDKGIDPEALSLDDCERIYADWLKANPPKKGGKKK